MLMLVLKIELLPTIETYTISVIYIPLFNSTNRFENRKIYESNEFVILKTKTTTAETKLTKKRNFVHRKRENRVYR